MALTLSERFWSKVSVGEAGDCWLFRGAKHPFGYGKFSINGKMETAHRVAMRLMGNEIAGRFVCHHCDNPPCCNPAHLYVGNAATNHADRVRRKRSRNGNTILTEVDVAEILSLRESGLFCRQIAERFGVKTVTIYALCEGRNWKGCYRPTAKASRLGERAGNVKITAAVALTIRGLRASGLTIRECAERTDVSESLATSVIYRKSWKHL